MAHRGKAHTEHNTTHTVTVTFFTIGEFSWIPKLLAIWRQVSVQPSR
jgi:hypothetical protein